MITYTHVSCLLREASCFPKSAPFISLDRLSLWVFPSKGFFALLLPVQLLSLFLIAAFLKWHLATYLDELMHGRRSDLTGNILRTNEEPLEQKERMELLACRTPISTLYPQSV